MTFDALLSVRKSLSDKTMPNVEAVICTAISSMNESEQDAAEKKMRKSVSEMSSGCLTYFNAKFGDLDAPGLTGEMPYLMNFFKFARLTDPLVVCKLKPTEKDVDGFISSLPCIRKGLLQFGEKDEFAKFREGFKKELPLYLALAAAFNPEGEILSDTRGRMFWAVCGRRIPRWKRVALLISVAVPSSGCAERVFRILRLTFGKDSLSALRDYVKASLMWQVSSAFSLLPAVCMIHISESLTFLGLRAVQYHSAKEEGEEKNYR